MASTQPIYLTIKTKTERYQSLTDEHLVLLEEVVLEEDPNGLNDPIVGWEEWPSQTPSVAYDADGNNVKYLPTPKGTDFEIVLDTTFNNVANSTGEWWYGKFTTTSGYNHVFTAEQNGLIDNNSFTFLHNEKNNTILIKTDNFVYEEGNGYLYVEYENGTENSEIVEPLYYGNDYYNEKYVKIVIPDYFDGNKVYLKWYNYEK